MILCPICNTDLFCESHHYFVRQHVLVAMLIVEADMIESEALISVLCVSTLFASLKFATYNLFRGKQ